jgi:hypothetical protein
MLELKNQGRALPQYGKLATQALPLSWKKLVEPQHKAGHDWRERS